MFLNCIQELHIECIVLSTCFFPSSHWYGLIMLICEDYQLYKIPLLHKITHIFPY